MRTVVALLMMVLAGSAAADTVVMRGSGQTAPITLRAANGDTWSCSASSVTIRGAFNNMKAVTVDSMSAVATCQQTASQPAPAAGSTTFTQTNYVANASIGLTYITVRRSGNAGLSVTWSAEGNVTPKSGTLTWGAGDASLRYIKLSLPAPGVSTLRLPGATATLTVSP